MGNKANNKNSSSGLALSYSEPAIENVTFVDDFTLAVKFEGGVVKHVDMLPILRGDPVLALLEKNVPLFWRFKFTKYGISWTDELDISSWSLWENGTIVATQFDGLIGMHEATDRWGLNESTIRKAIAAGKLAEGIDFKKFGNQYILTEASIRRTYGNPLDEVNPDEFDYPYAVLKRYYNSKKK